MRQTLRRTLIGLALAWSSMPILLVVLSSFKEANQIFEVPPSLVFRPTLGNYPTLWTSRPEFFRALGMLGTVEGVQWGGIFAAAAVQLVPVLALVIALQRYPVAGPTAGTVKQ